MWSDSGIVVSIKKYGERSRLIDIFFRDHGKVSGFVRHHNGFKIAPFDIVDVEYVCKKTGSSCAWNIKKSTSSWMYILHKQIYLLVCQAMCYSISHLIYSNIKYSDLFDIVFKIASSLQTSSTHEILNLYGYFDLFILYSLGYGFDLKCSCGNVSQIITKDGDSFCRACPVDNDCFNIPTVWNSWMEGKFNETDVSVLLGSFDIVDYFIAKYFQKFDNSFKKLLIGALVCSNK